MLQASAGRECCFFVHMCAVQGARGWEVGKIGLFSVGFGQMYILHHYCPVNSWISPDKFPAPWALSL